MIFHGYAKAKVDDIEAVKKGEEGILTAYFPYGDDDPVAAVWFGEKRWMTFRGWTEAQFLERFEVDRKEDTMYKEDGRLKPADPKETANIKGKTLVCWKCGHREVRNSLEFSEVPRCPKCTEGALHEELDV